MTVGTKSANLSMLCKILKQHLKLLEILLIKIFLMRSGEAFENYFAAGLASE